MKAYRAGWWLIWSAVAAVAIGVACLAWTPTVVAVTFLMAAATIWCAAMLWVRELRPRTGGQPGVRGCARIGAWGGVGVLAVLSLADIAERSRRRSWSSPPARRPPPCGGLAANSGQPADAVPAGGCGSPSTQRSRTVPGSGFSPRSSLTSVTPSSVGHGGRVISR